MKKSKRAAENLEQESNRKKQRLTVGAQFEPEKLSEAIIEQIERLSQKSYSSESEFVMSVISEVVSQMTSDSSQVEELRDFLDTLVETDPGLRADIVAGYSKR